MENIILLADKNSDSWDFAEKIQDYIRSKKGIEISLKEVIFKKFRNGEIKPKVLDNVRKKDVYFIHDSNKNPQEWWTELILLKDLLLSSSVESISFILPDMYYSRQDRKDEPHVPISARAVAKTISSGVKRIITMDLHSSQIQGFYPENIPFDTLESFQTVVSYLKENKPNECSGDLVVCSPDAGGTKRAGKFANKLQSKYPVAFIDKKRDPITNEIIEMRLSGDVQDKDVLIVDDLIDSGGTLIDGAKLLKEKGAKKLFCYGTHGLFTEGAEKICNVFERIMTSNTHQQTDKSIEIIDVSGVFAEAIYRAQKGESISELFK
ncbi:MAG: ribose-phosphate pyrophosphokinase [archaeon]|nr:ribose-phosphate pyrophosphokinase [archaeon]